MENQLSILFVLSSSLPLAFAFGLAADTFVMFKHIGKVSPVHLTKTFPYPITKKQPTILVPKLAWY